MKDNAIFDKEAYEKELKSYMDYVSIQDYDTDQQVNQAIRANIINNWIADHNVNANEQAWFNPRNKYIKAKDKWQTDKWQNLNKPENAPMLKLYNAFQKLLRKSEKLGMLDEYSPEFIPSLYKSKIDQLVFGGNIFSKQGFLEELEVTTEIGRAHV